MQLTARTYLTSGVAALSAGAIALAPIQPLPSQGAAQEKAVSHLAVNLAATIDPITPWMDTFKLAGANLKALSDYYMQKPFPLLQTIGANTQTYFKELTNGQAGLIPEQIGKNLKTFFEAPWDPGPCLSNDPCGDPAFYEGVYISTVPITVPPGFTGFSQRALYKLLPATLSAELKKTLAPILAFAGNHFSGQLAGLIGAVAGPLVQLTRSFTAVGDLFKAGDTTGAINELINIPANVTNAWLNGAGYLDLTPVVNAIQPLPPELKTIGVNLGGLISPPVPFKGSLANPTAVDGGTLFDNIAVSAAAGPISVVSPGLPVSWVGSAIGLGQFLGEQMVVTPPPTKTAAATAAPAAATPAIPATPAEPAIPAIPAEDEAPATPAIPATPAESATPAVPDNPAASHRGGGNDKSDNGGKSGGRNHRGAA